MRNQMKRPAIPGVGRRNDTVETLRTNRVMEQAVEHAKAEARRKRPQARAMDPAQRVIINAIITCRGELNPAQRRRAKKKANRWWAREGATWRRPGSDVSAATDGAELPEFDPEQCACQAMNNPPCPYCENGQYQL